MKTKFIALLLTLAWTLPSLASVKAYIHDDGSFFYRPDVVVDGKKLEMSWWNGSYELSQSMKTSPTAFALAEEHERLAKKGAIFIWSGLGAALAYSFAVPRADYNPSIYWGLFAAGFLPGVYFSRQSHKALMDSINTYNGVQSTGQNDMKLNFYLLPSENPQVGLRLEF